jgi:phage tail sheath protein FI
VNVFGTPAPGGAGDDVWREGTNKTAPTYGAYAAQAYLRNSSPLTYIRLLGAETEADGGPAAASAGEAGWSMNSAYGLFVFTDTTGSQELTGALAAIFYCNADTEIMLSGNVVTSGSSDGIPQIALSASAYTGSHIMVRDTGADYEFKVQIKNASGSADTVTSYTCNFNENSSRYIRKVFNTNPQKTNANVAAPGTAVQYFLGETFDRHLKANVSSADIAASNTGRTMGSVAKLINGATTAGSDYAGASAQGAQSPTIISCRLSPSSTPENLFAIHALNVPGDWTNRNIKVSIQDIKRSTNNENSYGSFSVLIRALSDSDNVVQIIERFDECDLNPDSLNYVARKIGDTYLKWNEDERRYNEKGNHPNNSRFIRVAMGSNVDAGLMESTSLVPFGFQGIVKYDDEELTNASAADGNWATGSIDSDDFPVLAGAAADDVWCSGSVFALLSPTDAFASGTGLKIKALYPAPELRVSASAGNLSTKTDAYFGLQTTQTAGGTVFDKSNIDLLRPRGGMVGNMFAGAAASIREESVEFTLDDISGSAGVWVSGSHDAASTPTAAATATITITDFTELNDLDKVNLIATDGNNYNFVVGVQSSVNGTFEAATSNTATATNLMNVINTSSGPAGTRFTATSDGAVVTVTQAVDGASGNTDITITETGGTGMSKTDFSDGQSPAPGTSLTFVNGAISGVLDQGFDRFTVPVYGGFDGLNITEMDPFNSSARTLPSNATDRTSYEFNSIRRAITSIADPEVVEMNMAVAPGLRQESLTTQLINTCEDRADALAIIDLPQGFLPRAQSNSSAADRRGNTASSVTQAVNGLRQRGLNSSYGCTYYPWVRCRDTLNGADVWLPPSIPALGTFSSSQRKTQVWFAPAGFNRGGLTEGSAGIPVVGVAHHLRRKDRDDLYAANINPIAKFPAEGIVIFGQKTLQVTSSALDRIGVRRLMIFVKKRISQIAAGLLFDPNVKQTWLRFTAQVNPFLSDVKTNFGLSDFKVVLDDSTTTPDLVDRNIMYAQIFLKPTRAIEYIAIDFNISHTGASFED